MNPKNYHKKFNYKESDSDEDFEDEDDYLQGEEDISENNSSNNYNYYEQNNNRNSQIQNPYSTSGGISKYDIGSSNNLMKTTNKFTNNKNSNNNTNYNYDIYSGGSPNYGMRDSYNIDIDLNKIKKENEISNANVNKETKNFLQGVSNNKKGHNIKLENENSFNPFPKNNFDKNSSNDITENVIKPKKKRNFLDDLDEELDKEQKKEEELENLNLVESEYSYYKNVEDNNESQEDIHKKKNEDTIENHFDTNEKKFNNLDEDNNEEEGNDLTGNRDSTISIDKYLNNYNLNKDQEEEQEQNLSIKSRNELYKYDGDYEKKQNNKSEINDMSKFIDRSNNNINKPLETLKSHSDNYSNYSNENIKKIQNKFNSANNNYSNSNYNSEDAYDKFDEDISSNLAESNNDHPLNLGKSSLSNNELKNIMASSSSDNLNRKEKSNLSDRSNSKSNNKSSQKSLYGNKNINLQNVENVEDNNFNKNVKKKSLEDIKQESKININNNEENRFTFINTTENNLNNNNNLTLGNKTNTPKFDINYNQEYIQNIIQEEFRKLLTSSGINPKLSSESPHNNIHCNSNPTKINMAYQELQDRLKSFSVSNSQNFLIYSDSHNKFKTYNLNKLLIYNTEDFFISRSFLPKKDLTSMKLQIALDEERKRKDFFELNYNRLKETNEENEIKLRKMQILEIENKESHKLKLETEEKYKDLEKDLINLKNDYEVKLKLMEERILLRESKNEMRRMNDLQRKYEIEIDNFKLELEERLNELNEYKNKFQFYEKENTKLSMNKIQNLETNDKFKELRNENFILYEKLNEVTNKYERNCQDKEKLEKIIIDKEMESELKEISTNNKEMNSSKNKFSYINNEKGNENLKKNNFIDFTASQLNYNNKINSTNIFDQIMIERENNVQDAIIKSYMKEIERLNNEIRLLKNMVGLGVGSSSNNTNLKHNSSTNFNNTNTKTHFNNYLQSSNNNFNSNKNNLIKETAEEKIKLLTKILLNNDNNITITSLENEFVLNDKNSNLSTDLLSGEIEIDSFINILLNILKIPFSKYELIEIFNNFPRCGINKIRYNDLLNALKSKNPFNFFIQPDPNYLKEIEVKIINYENKIKEYQNSLEVFKLKEIEIQNKLLNLENENKNLKNDLKNKNENSENLLGSLIKGGLLNSNNKSDDLSNTIKKLKEKIKLLESSNINNLNEFEKKVSQYEIKFDEMRKDLENNRNINDNNNIENINNNQLIKELCSIKEENIILKSKISEIELINKNETSKLSDKLIKYKKTYIKYKESLEKSEKDKEKIILNFSKSKNLDLSPNIIQNFIINTEEIQIMTQKINELEKKNIEREDHYKQLCYNSNQHQLNKELDSLNKKFENERKELKKIINQKNNDILNIKKEFEEIYRELEEIKYSRKK